MIDLLIWPFTTAIAGIAALISIAIVIFWIWMLVDCAKRKFRNTVEKVIWILVLVFISWIGAIIYLIIIKLYNPRGLFK